MSASFGAHGPLKWYQVRHAHRLTERSEDFGSITRQLALQPRQSLLSTRVLASSDLPFSDVHYETLNGSCERNPSLVPRVTTCRGIA